MSTEPTQGRIVFERRPNVAFTGLRSAESMVFFGRVLGSECERCGAYEQTAAGHKYCSYVSCPIALLAAKRRARSRTSSLEKVYVPLLTRNAPPDDAHSLA